MQPFLFHKQKRSGCTGELSLFADIRVTRRPEVRTLTVFTLSLDMSDLSAGELALCVSSLHRKSRSIPNLSRPTRAPAAAWETLRQDAAEGSGARISARADRLSQSRTFRFDPHRSIRSRQRLMRATVAAESVARSHRVQARRRVSG